MRRRDHNIFANATSLLICGLLAGVVVAAAAFPAVAMSGLAAKAGGQTFASLPSELKRASAPQISRIFASDNKTQISVFYDEFRSDAPLKDISVHMQHAIIAAEDHEFYNHNGVDLKGVARAVVSNKSGKSQQGASTLTMQYVRMSLAYSATNPQEVVDATKDSPKRKITEMKYAMQVEKELTKEQILENYLNQAPFGNGSYGVYAASQVYFKKKPKDLTIAESALLASMVKAPSAFNPTTASGYPQALARRNYVVEDMLELKFITPDEAKKATATKISKTVQRVGNGCVSAAKNHWGFFCDYFYRWWLGRNEFGATTYDRERRLKSGGYRIQTSMDIKAQNAARENIGDHIKEKNKNALLLAGIQPGTGKVRALAANRRFKLDDPEHPQNKISSDPRKAKKKIRGSYPNTTNPLMSGGGDITGYQAGSVFKIFTVIAALENGYPLAYPINAPAKYVSKYIIRPGPSTCNGKYYCPSNSGGKAGGLTNMWTGFGKSINTFFVPLQERVGAEKVVDVAQRFGVQFRAKQDADFAATKQSAHQWGAFTLGVSSSTPLDMANAYATLAGDGMYCTPTPVEQITSHSGEKIDVGKPHCTRATSPDVARAAIDAARCPVGDSAQLGRCAGATAPGAHATIRHPIYGKTGTTDADKTASLIIGSSSLTVAGYLVNPDYQDHSDHMSHSIVNPAVWDTMRDYLKGTPKVQFKKPGSRKISIGDQRSIPDVTCATIDGARNRLESAGFSATVGTEVESDCPKGTAAGTSPSGRTIKGGYVSIEVSKGKGGKPGPGDGGGPPRRPGRR
ncbi:carboxypeptidase [Actinoplanes sp. NBRC 14428]|uniref:Membrane peptidoglycan carboxypeptidase n=1 Tax=Pseudosporangium ferrugineum TaxID=439699 RepID=A0A2T0S6A0_9ACTN|nr:transglycosylase domain-containing protein [Pseudosporangium ferrugineum]PRY28940.1 membrane peptidoglycan carboxypeptidase [Pseudosporangium ferrugineum]BCJ53595.1 carboxypeptidase [Actinoplanes sp. NBRC 14428]